MFRSLATPALLATLALAAVGCGRKTHFEPDAFSWSDELPPGSVVHLRTTQGRVVVRGTAQSRIHVQGTKRWRRGRERDVRFVVERDGDVVHLCAIWVRRGGRCGDRHIDRRPPRWLAVFSLIRRRTDMAASFEVMLPHGVRVDASTVNGDVAITEAGSDVIAETVNGSIRASTLGGRLSLKTVNGSIHARAASLPDDAGINLESVNGSIRAQLPADLDADVALSTVNGRLTTDFPVSVSGGRSAGRQLRGVVGKGGRRVRLNTVNGSIELTTASGHHGRQKHEEPGF